MPAHNHQAVDAAISNVLANDQSRCSNRQLLPPLHLPSAAGASILLTSSRQAAARRIEGPHKLRFIAPKRRSKLLAFRSHHPDEAQTTSYSGNDVPARPPHQSASIQVLTLAAIRGLAPSRMTTAKITLRGSMLWNRGHHQRAARRIGRCGAGLRLLRHTVFITSVDMLMIAIRARKFFMLLDRLLTNLPVAPVTVSARRSSGLRKC